MTSNFSKEYKSRATVLVGSPVLRDNSLIPAGLFDISSRMAKALSMLCTIFTRDPDFELPK